MHGVAVAVVLPFLVLAAYCHPYYDDYGTALELQRTGFVSYFTTFYQTLFPSWRAQGHPLSEAFRQAIYACLPPPPGERTAEKLEWRNVNSIILYGHPGFEFDSTLRSTGISKD